MRFKFLGVILVVVFAFQPKAKAQDNAELSEQYQNMIQSSETFERYKVIPLTKINEFSLVLNDTIESLKSKITSAQTAKRTAEKERNDAQSKMSNLEMELKEAQAAVDNMPLLGISMTKTTYNIVVWTIIAALLVGLGVLYVMFVKSFRLTRQAKKDKELVDQEIEDLRKRSHEKQVKIKRELQTALNKLDEYKR